MITPLPLSPGGSGTSAASASARALGYRQRQRPVRGVRTGSSSKDMLERFICFAKGDRLRAIVPLATPNPRTHCSGERLFTPYKKAHAFVKGSAGPKALSWPRLSLPLFISGPPPWLFLKPDFCDRPLSPVGLVRRMTAAFSVGPSARTYRDLPVLGFLPGGPLAAVSGGAFRYGRMSPRLRHGFLPFSHAVREDSHLPRLAQDLHGSQKGTKISAPDVSLEVGP